MGKLRNPKEGVRLMGQIVGLIAVKIDANNYCHGGSSRIAAVKLRHTRTRPVVFRYRDQEAELRAEKGEWKWT